MITKCIENQNETKSQNWSVIVNGKSAQNILDSKCHLLRLLGSFNSVFGGFSNGLYNQADDEFCLHFFT